MSKTIAAAIVVAVAGSAGAVARPLATPIFSSVVGTPSNAVPGVPGALFLAGTSIFERPYRSPDGTRWVIRGRTNLPTTEDQAIFRGAGASGAGAIVVAREGTPAPWSPGVNIETLTRRNMGVNDSGDVAFGANAAGTTTNDEFIVRRLSDGTYSAIAQEGQPAPDIAGATFGATLDSAHILNNGDVGHRALLVGPPTTLNSGLFRGGSLLVQEGVGIPTGQAGGASNAWENFGLDDFYSDATGANYLVAGDLLGATTGDNVVVVNNQVRLQEGSPVSGSSFTSPVTAFGEQIMTPSGDWYARGSNADGEDWYVRNGAVLATTDDTITASTAERWDDGIFTSTFFWIGGNSVGDYIVGGVTDNPDLNANAVLVWNGVQVVAREGDPVDLNNNGLPDDDAFISVFNNDDGFLTDDNILYFTADLRNAAGTTIGQAFLTVAVPAPGPAALLALAGVAGLRRRR